MTRARYILLSLVLALASALPCARAQAAPAGMRRTDHGRGVVREQHGHAIGDQHRAYRAREPRHRGVRRRLGRAAARFVCIRNVRSVNLPQPHRRAGQ